MDYAADVSTNDGVLPTASDNQERKGRDSEGGDKIPVGEERRKLMGRIAETMPDQG